jgi:hypothetical protein
LRRREARWLAHRVRAAAGSALWLALAACTAPSPPPDAAPAEPVLTDALGREYVVRTLERSRAEPAGEGKARMNPGGIVLELAGPDDDPSSWHYKVYLPPERAAAPEPEVVRAAPEPPPSVEIDESDALAFERVGAGLPESGQWREGFDVADVDGDGSLDVVHGPARKGARRPHVWRGDGRGGFSAWREARFPALPYDYGDARVGDFDGDGHADVALAVHLRGLVLLLGDGRGAFRAAGAGLDWSADAAAFSSRAIRAADLDGDGRLDLAALGEGPRLVRPPSGGAAGVAGGAEGVAVYRGLGDVRFAPRAAPRDPAAIHGVSLALGDFDGDGRTDVATGSTQIGRTDLVQLAGTGGVLEPLALATVRARSYVRSVAAADFDGDGRSDLALSYVSIATGAWWSGIDVLLARDGADWPRVALAAREGRDDFRALAAGDLDGDGAQDLAAVDAAGALAIFRGDGRGSFTREREPPAPLPGACRGAHLAIADLDRDGRGDLIASFGQEPGEGAARRCAAQGALAAWRSIGHDPGR